MTTEATIATSVDADDETLSEAVLASPNTNNTFDVYHREYFDSATGKGPSDKATAKHWWKYRRNQPNENSATIIDTPDGEHMLWEIEDTRTNLRKFVKDELFHMFIKKMKEHNQVVPRTLQYPRLPKDIMKILSTYDNTPENQRLVYMIFHQFHRTRTWLAKTIDAFFQNNNMRLLSNVRVENKKLYNESRGGFGTVEFFPSTLI